MNYALSFDIARPKLTRRTSRPIIEGLKIKWQNSGHRSYRHYSWRANGHTANRLNAPGPAGIMVLLIIPIIKIVSSQRLANDWHLPGPGSWKRFKEHRFGWQIDWLRGWRGWRVRKIEENRIKSDQPKVQPNYVRFPCHIFVGGACLCVCATQIF